MIFIVTYGIWKNRHHQDLEGYLLGGRSSGWATVGLSVMATQASAITFISTTGQAFEDGMGFVQLYFGLPIAVIIICAVFIPIYYRSKVFTAYEYLEKRFDLKTRLLTAGLFLIQRGLAAGITIYAPAIILSHIFNWNIHATILAIGALVVAYTLSGGAKAVNQTQKQQMAVMMLGMAVVFGITLYKLPPGVGFIEALDVAGALGKINIIDTSINLESRYTLWSGITGGLFLSLSYFGTDQSQVQRYLTARNPDQSRMGLIFNGLLKIPMQFFILLCGLMVLIFYQFNPRPLYFNEVDRALVFSSSKADSLRILESEYQSLQSQRIKSSESYAQSNSPQLRQHLNEIHNSEKRLVARTRDLVKTVPKTVGNDKDYVFLSFILAHLPHGIIGLLLAVILSAAMSSTAGELNALATTTTVDLYQRLLMPSASAKHFVNAGKIFTFFWGAIAVLFASFAGFLENLIQAVNIVGSLFYGSILGVFLVAFLLKNIGANAVFTAAILAQTLVFILFKTSDIGYLWFNAIGCGAVVAGGWLLGKIF